MKIFVGCSQNNDIPKKYIEDCQKYLNNLFSVDNELVFGGCAKGLMNVAYCVAKENGRKITGVSTNYYKDNLKDLSCDYYFFEKTENDRHNKLIELADAIIFLPGGTGTISEIFSSIESKRAKEFDKPIIIYNSDCFYDKLIDFLNDATLKNFVSEEVASLYHISSDAKDTLDYLAKLTNC